MSNEPVNASKNQLNFYHTPADCPQCGKYSIIVHIPKVESVGLQIKESVDRKITFLRSYIPKIDLDKVKEYFKKHKVCIMFCVYYSIALSILGLSLRYIK